jgi:hypothetical protein
LSFGLVGIFLCSVGFKYIALTDLDDIQERMSLEQRDMYAVDPEVLTLITIACVLGALVLSFLLFAVQVTVEAQRMRREALASKARRLRLKTNSKEVLGPTLATGYFHTFLSHVWGSGQDQVGTLPTRRPSARAGRERSPFCSARASRDRCALSSSGCSR